MKRLAFIEDDISIRESLKIYIESQTQIDVIKSSGSVEEFLTLNFKNDPEILLLDIGLPGMSGVEGIPLIKSKYPDIDIIMLTTFEEQDVIFAALCAGACSYISKRTSLAKIVEALYIVDAGGSYMSPTIAKKIAQFFMAQPKKKESILSQRQLEIVNHIVTGLSYKEIAEQCFISINTVRTHIKNIYSQLEIHSKAVLIKRYNEGNL